MKDSLSWSLGEKKYLRIDEVRKLRISSECEKELALKIGNLVKVRDWLMIELGLHTGLRVAEMRNLKIGDINVEGEQASIVVRKGKGGKSRVVYIGSGFKKNYEWFLRWKMKQGQDVSHESYLLTKSSGKQLSKRALQKAFKRCIKRAGLPEYYSIHALRHTYGTHLYVASNHNLRLVQEQLGHSSIKITEVYANLIDSDIKKAVEKIYL